MKQYESFLPVRYSVAIRRALLDIEGKSIRELTYDACRRRDLEAIEKKGELEIKNVKIDIARIKELIESEQSSLESLVYSNMGRSTLDEQQKKLALLYQNKKKYYQELIDKCKKGKNIFSSNEVKDCSLDCFNEVTIKVSKKLEKTWRNKIKEYAESFMSDFLIDEYDKSKMIPSYIEHKKNICLLIASQSTKHSFNNMVLDERLFDNLNHDLRFFDSLLALETEGYLKIIDIGYRDINTLENLVEHRLMTSSNRNDFLWVRIRVFQSLIDYYNKYIFKGNAQVKNSESDIVEDIKPESQFKNFRDLSINSSIVKIGSKSLEISKLLKDDCSAVKVLELLISNDSTVQNSFISYEKLGEQFRKICSVKKTPHQKNRPPKNLEKYGGTLASRARTFLRKNGSKLTISKSSPYKLVDSAE